MNLYTTLDLISNDVPQSPSSIFLSFIDTFRVSDSFIYKDLLTRSILTETYTFSVSLTHISEFSSFLYDSIISDPTGVVEEIESILTQKHIHKKEISDLNFVSSKDSNFVDDNFSESLMKSFVLHFTSTASFTPIRFLNASFSNILVRVRGIVVSASLPVHKPLVVNISCKRCLRSLNVKSFIPRSCSSTCGLDSFQVNPIQSHTVDTQMLKVQELFEDIPPGEMPRHFPAICYRNLVDSVSAGDKVKITGIIQMVPGFNQGSSFLLLKVLGIEKEKKTKMSRFSDEEKSLFYKISRMKNFQDEYKVDDRSGFDKSSIDQHENNIENSHEENKRSRVMKKDRINDDGYDGFKFNKKNRENIDGETKLDKEECINEESRFYNENRINYAHESEDKNNSRSKRHIYKNNEDDNDNDKLNNTFNYNLPNKQFSKIGNNIIYEYLVSLFAPQIHGHKDIKKAILCLLFSGTRRSAHGTPLRPDINILLIGDPGCAKSQILKYTNLVSPGVYTSGKGSSAAGLTASVIRKKGGQFALEAGALVLSDMGVCCIDEFDKMDITDRVSIHEAMEQQTVSISKAGINTMLKTRCSVLAAANPVFGRYDSSKNLESNIDFGATVMSRFDCVFVVRDIGDKKSDIKLAKHLLDINIKCNNKFKEKNKMTTDDLNENDLANIDKEVENSSLFKDKLDFLRKYIGFAKSTCHPTLTEDAKNKLTLFYIQTRKLIQGTNLKVTVRQLESLIRLSEALAKMELNDMVTIKHVDEAIRLFTVSTIQSASLTNNSHFTQNLYENNIDTYITLAEKIGKMLPIGHLIEYTELVKKIGSNRKELIGQAVNLLEKNGKLEIKDNGKNIIRLY